MTLQADLHTTLLLVNGRQHVLLIVRLPVDGWGALWRHCVYVELLLRINWTNDSGCLLILCVEWFERGQELWLSEMLVVYCFVSWLDTCHLPGVKGLKTVWVCIIVEVPLLQWLYGFTFILLRFRVERIGTSTISSIATFLALKVAGWWGLQRLQVWFVRVFFGKWSRMLGLTLVIWLKIEVVISFFSRGFWRTRITTWIVILRLFRQIIFWV